MIIIELGVKRDLKSYNEVQITEACVDDINDVLKLTRCVADLHGALRGDILKSHPYHIRKDDVEKYIYNPNRIIYVAKDANRVIGIMFCKICNITNDNKLKDAVVMKIEDTCVDEQYRNYGVASNLLDKAMIYAKSHKCNRIESTVWGFNDESKLFFQANGFSIQKVIMEKNVNEE